MRLVIAEDDALLREGLALLLRVEGLDVVATAGTPEEFLAAVQEHRPDVAIVDERSRLWLNAHERRTLRRTTVADERLSASRQKTIRRRRSSAFRRKLSRYPRAS